MRPVSPSRSPQAAAGGPQIASGVGFMLAFAMLAPWIDIFAKLGSGAIPAGQYTFVRFTAQGAILLAVLMLTGRRLAPSPGLWPLHALRGGLMATAATFFIASVQVMPLADALAIFFVAPLLLTALSWAVLGERVGWRRLSACLLGFLGALIVVRPSFAALGPAALMPLATAATFVVYLLLTRRVAQVEGALAMQAWAGVFGAALMGLGLLLLPIPAFDPGWPPIEVWPLYIGGAAAAIVGHLFLVAAFARAPASLLAPLQYLELVTASVAGLLLFGDFPDLFSWLGILLIVGSGLFVLGRERAASHG